MTGGFLRSAFVPFDARDAMQQADHPARKALRIGDAITGQALAQIARLAHIQDALPFPAHIINTRPGRQRAKKFLTQPLE
jgi:hypothetical protein